MPKRMDHAVPRRRLAVALLLPEPWSTEIDGLRRACADLQLRRVPPHVTLASPVNVREEEVGAAQALLRAAAASQPGRVELVVGPTATFLPDAPVLFLAVGGPAVDDGRLQLMRSAVQERPLVRPARWPFVPHVTLAQDQPPDRLTTAATALAAYRVEVTVDRVHLLEEQVTGDGRRWVPIADAVAGPRVVVGRGSLPLELTTGSLVDPEALARWPGAGGSDPVAGERPSTEGRPVAGERPVAGRLVVTARRDGGGELVGLAAGPPMTHRPDTLVVAPEAAGEGVEEHLLARWRWLTAPA